MQRTRATEYAPYFERYVALVPENNIVEAMEAQIGEMQRLLGEVPESQANMRHPPYTWTIKEVVGHLTDTERIFCYRALRFARADKTPLPGFDENAYVPAANFNRFSLKDLAGEFEAVRRAHVSFFRGLNEEEWSRSGEANGNPMSVRALAYNIVGHVRHHAAIVRKRLGLGSAK